jgi:acyl-CoA dehydrogenase
LLETALAVRGGVGVIAARHDYAFWSRCEDENRFP